MKLSDLDQNDIQIVSPPQALKLSDLHPDDVQLVSHPESPKNRSWLETTARGAVNNLPLMGGMLGGVLGTPADAVTGPMGTVVGAGIGGYLGTAAKNAINRYIDPEQAPQTTTQVLSQPLIGGVEQAGMQGAGEVAAPMLAKGASAISEPVRAYLSKLAGKFAENATGATGLQASRFAPNAGQELIDRGIVGFGDTQEQIAAKATQALKKSGDNIGKSLQSLDAQGTTVSKSDIVQELRSRAATLSKDPATQDISKALLSKAEQIEGEAAANSTDVLSENSADFGVPDRVPLSEAEQTKRGFQQSVNYNSPKLETSVAGESADIYKQAVEKAAASQDPAMAEQFLNAKEDYGLLSPIQKAAERRAATTQQHQAGGFLDAASSAAGGLIGGLPGAVVAPIARRVLAPRAASSLAVGSDWLSQVVKASPSSLGRWAPVLTQAEARGGNALGAADYILQQTDPEYRQHLKEIHPDQSAIIGAN